MGLSSQAHGDTPPILHAQGTKVVTEDGKPIVLRGCNLGNWLLIEAWMLSWDIEDQETMIRVLTERFGAAEADRLLTLYRDGYITPRDFENIKRFGFNVVRLPFDSRMLIDTQGTLKPDAFKWLDRGLDMAEKAGVYVILDMHGAPGSQSKMDHTGQQNQNKLWSDPKLQQNMVDLWKRIAERYKDRGVVAAYDVMNEPYGDFQTDMRPALRELLPRCYKSIRSTGDQHLVIFPNTLGSGIAFYGDLKSQGFTQIAFTDHYYPGLFGSPSTLRSHAGVIDRAMPEAQTYLEQNDAVMLVGEFNVVLEKTGGDAMMRRYFDTFARHGWMATMWSYKILKPAAGLTPDNWYMVTNAQPLPAINLRTSSLAEIEGYFSALGSMPLQVDEPLLAALTSVTPPPIYLPHLDTLPHTAPAARQAGDWRLIDVDTTKTSRLENSGKRIAVVAAGKDIFGSHDSFAFLQQPSGEKNILTATVHSLADSSAWAKAGLMIRFGDPESKDYAAAPFAMINTFTDGSLAFIYREHANQPAKESKRVIAPLPCRLAIARDQDHIKAYTLSTDGSALLIGEVTIAAAAGPARIGLAVCSQNNNAYTVSSFEDIQLANDPSPPGKLVSHANAQIDASSSSILKNAHFADVLKDKSAWNHSGDPLQPTTAGISLTGQAGLWQDLSVVPGKSYAFAIRTHRVADAEGDISISIESTLNGTQLALADRTVAVSAIEGDVGWTVLRAQTVAASESLRVLIRYTGKHGSVAIDEAAAWMID